MTERPRALSKRLVPTLKMAGIVTFYFAVFVLILLAIVGASGTPP